MAQFVYIDETGSVGTAAARQPYLTLAAVLVHEDQVRQLGKALNQVAMQHLGWIPADFEFHGHEIWGGMKHWSVKAPHELIAAYEAAIDILEQLDLSVAHSSINKAALNTRYGGAADKNAYRLALQFLLEKIDGVGSQNSILVADETKGQELGAIKMVAEMQQWGGGEVPGRTLTTVIDSLHFVRSHASPGVQMADLVAYVIQRARRGQQGHPDAADALARLRVVVSDRTITWRQPWPPG